MKFWRIILFALILTASVIFLIIFVLTQGPGKNQEKERFVIVLNSSKEQIIGSLTEKGFLKNRSIFRLILFLSGKGEISPGAYMLSKNMNVFKLAEALSAGPYQKWIIIPPGKRKEQVALVVKKEIGWSDPLTANFIQIAEEGYLFPDTYLVNIDSDPQEVFTKLKANFNEKFDAKLQSDLLAQNIRNDTAIKIASLIERESGSDKDKPIIAGIIWNRLGKGMKLETDATVQYAKIVKSFEEVLEWWPQVLPEDIKSTFSPYNTYLFDGLPPGPICSPSLASIKAAVYPAQTDDLFYLHSPDKKIHTAKTYEEHLENIEKYLH